MTPQTATQKVEKDEIRPGQYVITDSRYQLPKDGKKDADAAWARKIESASKIIRASRVQGTSIHVTLRNSK